MCRCVAESLWVCGGGVHCDASCVLPNALWHWRDRQRHLLSESCTIIAPLYLKHPFPSQKESITRSVSVYSLMWLAHIVCVCVCVYVRIGPVGPSDSQPQRGTRVCVDASESERGSETDIRPKES